MLHLKFRSTIRFRHAGFLAAAMVTSVGLATAAYAVVPQDDNAELVLVSNAASYLGVNIRDLDDHGARALGLKTTNGVEVTAVDHDAPAGKAGVHLRDVILTVDGKPVTSALQFRETMKAFPPNKIVELSIVRQGKPMKFVIKLADRVKLQQQAWLQHFSVAPPQLGNTFSSVASRQAGDAASEDDSEGSEQVVLTRPYRIGAVLDSIGPQLAAYFGVKDGTGMLVKNVEPDSPAAQAGLQAGDVVLKLNDDTVTTPMDWIRAMRKVEDKPIQLTIMRNKHVETLTIAPPKTQALLDWPVLPEIDQQKLKTEMDALSSRLKNDPALSRDAMDKTIAKAQKELTLPDLNREIGKLDLDVSDLPDAVRLHDQVEHSLEKSGLSPDGKLSPELQQKLKEGMDKAQQQLRHSLDTLTLPDGSGLEPF